MDVGSLIGAEKTSAAARGGRDAGAEAKPDQGFDVVFDAAGAETGEARVDPAAVPAPRAEAAPRRKDEKNAAPGAELQAAAPEVALGSDDASPAANAAPTLVAPTPQLPQDRAARPRSVEAETVEEASVEEAGATPPRAAPAQAPGDVASAGPAAPRADRVAEEGAPTPRPVRASEPVSAEGPLKTLSEPSSEISADAPAERPAASPRHGVDAPEDAARPDAEAPRAVAAPAADAAPTPPADVAAQSVAEAPLPADGRAASADAPTDDARIGAPSDRGAAPIIAGKPGAPTQAPAAETAGETPRAAQREASGAAAAETPKAATPAPTAAESAGKAAQIAQSAGAVPAADAARAEERLLGRTRALERLEDRAADRAVERVGLETARPAEPTRSAAAAEARPAANVAAAAFADAEASDGADPEASGLEAAAPRLDAPRVAPSAAGPTLSAAATPGAVSGQIGAAILTRGDEKRIALQLDPAELGRVSIELTFKDDAVSIAVRAERQEALDLMRRGAADLERQLREAGLDFDSLSFGAEDPGADARGRSEAEGFGFERRARFAHEAAEALDPAAGRALDPLATAARAAARGGLDLRV